MHKLRLLTCICICGWTCAIFFVAIFSNLPIIPVYVSELKIHVSRLVYLVQTESCLPEYLTSLEVLGDSSNCNCDVLVLNYKERCSNISLPHVEYVFNSSTTWTTGRNLLYELAMKRNKIYHYYIFMDDDIEFYIIEEENKTRNPWRAFESSLKSIEPAVGVVYELRDLQRLYNYRKTKNCTLNGTHDFIPIVYFDAAFNAFHYKAVQHILPYSARFDNITWWYSQVDIDIKCELMFRGQVALHTYILAKNSKHRPYKRKYVNNQVIIQKVKDIMRTIPKQYQNATLIQEWKKYGLIHTSNSSTLCLAPTSPYKPIVPYRHLRNNSIAAI